MCEQKYPPHTYDVSDGDSYTGTLVYADHLLLLGYVLISLFFTFFLFFFFLWWEDDM